MVCFLATLKKSKEKRREKRKKEKKKEKEIKGFRFLEILF